MASPPYFCDQGIKLNTHGYGEILDNLLLPFAAASVKGKWVFQQDGAPSHTAKLTIKKLESTATSTARA